MVASLLTSNFPIRSSINLTSKSAPLIFNHYLCGAPALFQLHPLIYVCVFNGVSIQWWFSYSINGELVLAGMHAYATLVYNYSLQAACVR